MDYAAKIALDASRSGSYDAHTKAQRVTSQHHGASRGWLLRRRIPAHSNPLAERLIQTARGELNHTARDIEGSHFARF